MCCIALDVVLWLKKFLVNSYWFLRAFPVGKMNIFGSLPVSADLHGFVGIRAKSWGFYLKHHFARLLMKYCLMRGQMYTINIMNVSRQWWTPSRWASNMTSKVCVSNNFLKFKTFQSYVANNSPLKLKHYHQEKESSWSRIKISFIEMPLILSVYLVELLVNKHMYCLRATWESDYELDCGML